MIECSEYPEDIDICTVYSKFGKLMGFISDIEQPIVTEHSCEGMLADKPITTNTTYSWQIEGVYSGVTVKKPDNVMVEIKKRNNDLMVGEMMWRSWPSDKCDYPTITGPVGLQGTGKPIISRVGLIKE
jgi:hypothetical protein